jgi:integrase
MKSGDFQAWITTNAKLSPKTLGHYLSTYRQVLDFCDVEPNPARSPKVKLPKRVNEEVAPPQGDEWNAIKANVSKQVLLVARFIECEGVRVDEALRLTYGDVDFASGRVRVSKARTKGRTAGQRWLPDTGRAPRGDRRARPARGSAPRSAGVAGDHGHDGARPHVPRLP